jgi:hypothetical protein
MSSFSFELFGAVHTGKIEFSTFVGRQRAQKDDNATFCGGVQVGLEVLEVGTFEFTAETGFGTYPENDQRVRNFDIAIKSLIYNGEMFLPHISGGIGLMTFNSTQKTEDPNVSKVKFAKTTINMGLGFKVRVKKDFYARADHRYFHYSKDGNLTYRSSTSLGVSYSF